MAKRSGLGRGLDGMFTSYIGKEPAREQDGMADSVRESESPGRTRGTKAASGEKTGKGSAKGTEKTSSVKKKSSAAGSTKAAKSEKALQDEKGKDVTLLKISQVEPNREQPRKEFQEEALTQLAESIRQYGVIQPLVVQKRPDYYEIIAGERRWRAARMAGLKEVPVIIKDYTDQEIVEVSLIENIQREDLNPIEEALAYQRLLDEFSLRQEDIARRVSKNRTTITNSLRLLKLDERVRDMLIEGRLTSGHARALLSLEDPQQQYEAAQRIADGNLSVRDVEKLIKALKKGAAPKPREKASDTALDLVCADMAEQMKAVFGTQVKVSRRNRKAGRIEIAYYSMEELERIYDLIRRFKEG